MFWHKLGLKSGVFNFVGDAQNMLLEGRYHDGHVRCDDPQDPSTCHGFLLAVYASDFSGNKAQYFSRFQKERSDPVTFITNERLEGKEFLQHAHERLEEYHLYQIENATFTGECLSVALSERSPLR